MLHMLHQQTKKLSAACGIRQRVLLVLHRLLLLIDHKVVGNWQWLVACAYWHMSLSLPAMLGPPGDKAFCGIPAFQPPHSEILAAASWVASMPMCVLQTWA